MATTKTFAGDTFQLPLNREPKSSQWGTQVSNFLIKLADYAIPKTGGSYTLTAELSFGATYGLLLPYVKSASSNISTAGVVRLARADTIGWRNQANGADLEMGVNASNQLTFAGARVLQSGAGAIVNADVDAAAAIALSKLAALTVSKALVSSGAGVISPATTTAAEIELLAGLTSTAAKLNYLTSATGTTGTASTNVVFSTSPTLVTPVLGVATATSINKMAITAPATSSTLAVADGKTATVSNTLTFTGTDGSSVAFGAGGTAAYTGNKLSVFAATTSAELAGVISDETGSGKLAFATSPQFSTNIDLLAAAEARFYNAGGTFYTGFKGGNAAANKIWTLPLVDGAAGQVVKTDGSGALGWVSAATAGQEIFSAKSADYTVTDVDGLTTVFMTTAASNRTVTLPAAANNSGRYLLIKKVDSGAGTCIIARAGSDTIDGATSLTLYSQYSSVRLLCDGSTWHVLDIKRGVIPWKTITASSTPAGWSVSNIKGTAYEDSTGNWICTIALSGTATSFTAITFTIDGCTPVFSTALASAANSGTVVADCFIDSSASVRLVKTTTGVGVTVAGTFVCASKPTW